MLDLILRHLLDFNFPTASKKKQQKLTIALLMTFQITMKSCKMNISLMVLQKLPKVKLQTIPGKMTSKFLFELCQAFKYFKT